jgi:hypothetical protein
MLNELSNDPIQTAIARLEKQHEEDKQGMSWVELLSVDWKSLKYSAVNLIENKVVWYLLTIQRKASPFRTIDLVCFFPIFLS